MDSQPRGYATAAAGLIRTPAYHPSSVQSGTGIMVITSVGPGECLPLGAAKGLDFDFLSTRERFVFGRVEWRNCRSNTSQSSNWVSRHRLFTKANVDGSYCALMQEAPANHPGNGSGGLGHEDIHGREVSRVTCGV